MSAKDLNSRRDKILELIIDSYINTATPIASRAISRRLRSSLSPATIRNIMSDLEEMGFITHPHTSAGRIPTGKGYRYYIDGLMQAKLLTEEEKRQINKEFKTKAGELDDMLEKTSQVLSSITNHAGIVLFPVLEKSLFKHVELVKLSERRILTILMTESGMTEDIVIEIERDIENADLPRIMNFINSQIGGRPFSLIRKQIMQRLIAERDSFFYILEKAKDVIDTMLGMIKDNKIYLNGRSHITEQPEFRDAKRLRNILRLLEDEDFLLSILKKSLDEEGIKVYIGSELGEEFSECSLIACAYSLGDTPAGTLGVIAPTRMEYSKVIPLVEYIASTLSKQLS